MVNDLIEKYNNGFLTKNELFANIYIYVIIENDKCLINNLSLDLKELFLEFKEFLKCKQFMWSSGEIIIIKNIFEK